MRNRLKSLLTQFSIRDLIWAMVVAGLVACLIRERVAMRARLAVGREADQAKLEKQLRALEDQKADLKLASSALAATRQAVESARNAEEQIQAHREKFEELLKQKERMRRGEQLDPSYPIYYPPGGK